MYCQSVHELADMQSVAKIRMERVWREKRGDAIVKSNSRV